MTKKLFNIKIYTDGSVYPNPGEGGWCCVLIGEFKNGTKIKTISGHEPAPTTNNRMEVYSVIRGLKEIKKPEQVNVTIYSDSQWTIGALSGSYKRIKKNLDLVREGKEIISKFHNVKWNWVKGHSGDEWNEVCNKLAYDRMKEKTPEEIIEEKIISTSEN